MVHDASRVWKTQKELIFNFLKILGSAEHGLRHSHVSRPYSPLCYEYTSTWLETWPCGHCCTPKNTFFEAATLATKVTTLVTMHILNHNICNSYFSIQNNTQKIKMISTLAITHMLKVTTLANLETYNYNTCNYEPFSMQIMWSEWRSKQPNMQNFKKF